MTEREKFEFREKKKAIYNERGWCCEACGKMLAMGNFDLAHRIGQGNIALYGKEIIHHRLNVAISCKNADCNDSFNIGNMPGQVKILVVEIKEAIKEEKYG